MKKQGELGRSWESFGSRREPAPAKHPLAFSRERGSAGASPARLLVSHPWLSPPKPSLHLPPSLGSVPKASLHPLRMLCPSSKTPGTVLEVTEPLEQGCQLRFPIQGLQERSVWVLEERCSCVKCEILPWDLQGFPTLGWSPCCRVGRFGGDKSIFLAGCDTLILAPCLVWVFS